MTEDRILIIDDDSIFVSQLAELLHKKGYKVGFALNAENAMQMLTATNYDVIILDLYMPRVDGMEFLKEVKSIKSLSLIPVLMSTAEADKKVVIEALKSGADDYIIKPIDVDKILEKVRGLLKIRHFVKRWGVLPK